MYKYLTSKLVAASLQAFSILSQCDAGTHNVTISNVEISEGQHGDHDGAITAIGPCNVTLNEMHYISNIGTAMVLKSGASGFARNCWFHNNSVMSNAAAILVQEQATLTLSKSFFINNSGNTGGAINVEVCTLLFVDSCPTATMYYALAKCFLYKCVVLSIQYQAPINGGHNYVLQEAGEVIKDLLIMLILDVNILAQSYLILV